MPKQNEITIDNYNSYQRKPTRKDAEHLLKSLNTIYHLTITFERGTTDSTCLKYLNEFFKRLNQRVHGRMFQRDDKYIEGAAICERTAFGTAHFHTLLAEHRNLLPRRKELETAISSTIHSFPKLIRLSGNQTFRRGVFTENGILLQGYYEGNLEHYLTKAYNNPHSILDDKTDIIGLLGKYRVEFGGRIGKQKY